METLIYNICDYTVEDIISRLSKSYDIISYQVSNITPLSCTVTVNCTRK